MRDGLSFAMAPHAQTEGRERVYHFELLEGGRFAEQRQCGVLQISGHCTLFAVVFKVKASSLYYASLWTHQVGGAVIADNEMHSKKWSSPMLPWCGLRLVVVSSVPLKGVCMYAIECCGNDLQWLGKVLVGMWYVHWYWILTSVPPTCTGP